MDLRVSASRRRRAHLSDKRCGGHLSTSHTIDCIIDKDRRYILASGSGMYNLRSTNGSQITITLIRENYLIRMDSFDSRGNSRRPTMSCFLHINVKVIIGQYCTAYRRYANCFFLHAQFIKNFRYQTVNNTMSAPRTVMSFGKCQGFGAFKDLSLIHISEPTRLG